MEAWSLGGTEGEKKRPGIALLRQMPAPANRKSAESGGRKSVEEVAFGEAFDGFDALDRTRDVI
jgi:hypothetical protein